MDTNPSHTRFIVGCITAITIVCIGCGFWLLLKGFQSGEILITSGGCSGLSGLIGFLGGKMSSGQNPFISAPVSIAPTKLTATAPPAAK